MSVNLKMKCLAQTVVNLDVFRLKFALFEEDTWQIIVAAKESQT